MNLIKKDFVCPYCFSKQDLYKIKFRCQNSPSKCSFEVDYEYADFRGNSPIPMNRVFEIPYPKSTIEKFKALQLPKELECPNCSELSSIRVCPNCHTELPNTIGEYKDLVFAVIGAKESGKSHYISVLINTIENQISRLFNANFDTLGDNTIRKYREEFYNPIFKNREVIPETRSARGDYNVKMPMVFSLSFMNKNIWGKSTISNVTTISFFDTAGEDLNAQETMKTENKYIYNSSGIILLVDPLQIMEVRNQLMSKGINLPKINTETEDIISRVAKLIRTTQKLSVNEPIDIPIAVAFSKIDALVELLDKSSSLQTSGKHDGYFNVSDANNVSTEIENMMVEWAGFHLVQQVKHNFKNYSFFGVSALGSNPQGLNKIEKLRPIRVEDPFLWLLYKNYIISDRNFFRDIFIFLHRLKFKICKKKFAFLYFLITLSIVILATTAILFSYPYITQITKVSDSPPIYQQIVYYKDIVGNYYGTITDANNNIKTGYMVIQQNPFDSTKFFTHLKFDIKKNGLNNSLIFNKDSMSLSSEVLGMGRLKLGSTKNKLILVSDKKNRLIWQFEK